MRKHTIGLSGLLLGLALTGLALTSAGCAGTAAHRSTGAYVDDKGISTRVKTALFRDPLVSGFDVHVNTFRGDVQLSGFVDSPEQRERAAQIAREIAGVQTVTNNLEVKPGAIGAPGSTVSGTAGPITQPVPERPAADYPNNYPNNLAPGQPLPGTVNNTLPPRTAPPIDNRWRDRDNQLDINVTNGRATIRGVVGTDHQRRDIEKRVREMPGVDSIDDQLQVQRP